MQKEKIAHLSSVHKDRDVRIFLKECVSLSEAGYDTHLIIPNVESRTEEGVTIHSFKHQPKSRLGRMWDTVNKVYKMAVELDAAVYHIHDPELLRIAKKLAKRGKKVVYDSHEDLPRAIMSKHYIPLSLRKIVSKRIELYEDKIVSKLAGVITATPFINERFIRVNPNSLNVNNFPLRSEIDFQQEEGEREQEVCYIGGITKIRGVKEMINAVGKAKVPFHMAGAWTDALRLEMRQEDGWEFVNELGFISREEANSLKASCMAGILTFLPEPNHINAQPNKMFEYMASGLPIIASNFPLWKEIIEKNNTGICVDPSSSDDIANAITYIKEHPEEAKVMGENGHRLVMEKFNWDIEKLKLIEFYNKLTSDNP